MPKAENDLDISGILKNQADWEKYVWIEQYGSLTDFPK